MREYLNAQADKIEQILWSHGLVARVWGGVVTPRLVRFNLTLAPGVIGRSTSSSLHRLTALADDLALALGVSQCRVQRQGAQVCLEVPREEGGGDLPFFALAEGLGITPPPFTALLGLGEDGTPLLLRLSSPEVAHVLIAGTTGSGKTELARTIAAGLARWNPPTRVDGRPPLRLVLVDPKGRAFRDFAGLPHLVFPVVTEIGEALERLEGLVAEMERRDRAGTCEPRLVVFVDELADLLQTGGKRAQGALVRLVQRGREAGIHVVACTQRPAAVVIGGLLKANFPCRLVGRVTSTEDARIATGLKGSGAERLQGRGDFLLVVQGEMRRLQVARVRPEDIKRLKWRTEDGGWRMENHFHFPPSAAG